jgi:competence protein ComEC
METSEQTSTTIHITPPRSAILLDALRHRPLTALSISFLAGIALRALTESIFPFIAFILAGILLILKYNRMPAAVLAGIACVGIACGGLRYAAYTTAGDNDIRAWNDRSGLRRVSGIVANDPERNKDRIVYILDVKSADSQAASGLVYVAERDESQKSPMPAYGESLSIRGILSEPRAAGNPGGFSWRDYLARRRIYSAMFARGAFAVEHLGEGGANPYLKAAWWTRARISQAIRSSVAFVPASLLLGILIGRRTDLPAHLSAVFVNTGTAHLLASAGLHVGILALGLLFLFERLTLPRKFGAFTIIATLWLYAAMCGGRPSVTRAVIMATVYFGAILFEREPDIPSSIAAAAFIILLCQPTALYETAFQLSFMTVITLAVTMPVWNKYVQSRIASLTWNSRGKKALSIAAGLTGLSLMAQLGAAPIVASAYNEVSLGGVVANLLTAPALFLIIPIGMAGSLIWYLWNAAGILLLRIDSFLVMYIAYVVRYFGEGQWAYVAVQSPSFIAIAFYYAIIYAISCYIQSSSR